MTGHAERAADLTHEGLNEPGHQTHEDRLLILMAAQVHATLALLPADTASAPPPAPAAEPSPPDRIYEITTAGDVLVRVSRGSGAYGIQIETVLGSSAFTSLTQAQADAIVAALVRLGASLPAARR